MKIISQTAKDDLATVYIGETDSGKTIEFVESVQPPYPREKKWVFIISTLCGCPVGCPICDAGNFYKGKLSEEEIFSQIDFLISTRYPGRTVPSEKWEGVNWGLFSGDDESMKIFVGRIVDHLERLECKTLLLPE